MTNIPPEPDFPFEMSEPPPGEVGDVEGFEESPVPGGLVETAMSLGAQSLTPPPGPASAPAKAKAKPAAPAAPAAPAPGDADSDKPRIEMNTVLYRPVQLDSEGNPSSAHWVSAKVTTNGDPGEVLGIFETLMRKMWEQGYIERPPQSSAAFQGIPAGAPPAISAPNKPSTSPDALKQAPAPTAPPAAPAGGGSNDTGRSPLHTIQVNPNGTVEFSVGNFNWPFKDNRYAPDKSTAQGVFSAVFDPNTQFTLQHLQTPKIYNLEGHGYFVDWEKVQKNGKTYYNVVKVVRNP